MTWRKFFKPVNSVLPSGQRTADTNTAYTATTKYNNWLPEVYAGPPDRIQRYAVYDQMNYDHEISAALDTIADFGTEEDAVTKLPVVIKYNDEPTPTEIQVLEKSLSQWVRLNKLTKRIWRMFRSTLVYGDQFFIRDPETFKLYWVDPSKVEKVIVNESEGKRIESYFIKDIDLNVKNLVATNQLNRMSSEAFGGSNILFSPPMNGNVNYVTTAHGAGGLSNFNDNSAIPVDAEHIVQLSLSEGMNAAWPFGLSILEQIYKVYKQKELLEDAILIYRIHRAPERRMFFIDVGTMPPNKAHQYLERVKYEVQQKRIPSRSGGGASIVDSTYNPMSIMEDYFFAVTSDGRGSKVETLPGGDNLGCFALDTKVDLMDGRSLSIQEISKELEQSQQLWTYSCHPVTGELAPGLISWAGKTKSDAQVMRITLDNGVEIVCTPDHKYPILGLGFVEAQHLQVGQSLTPLYRTSAPISEHSTYPSEQVYDPAKKEYVYTHRMAADFMVKHATGKDVTSVSERLDWLMVNDDDFRNKFTNCETLLRSTVEDLHRWKLDEYYNAAFESGRIVYDAILYQRLNELYKANPRVGAGKFAKVVSADKEFMTHYAYINRKVCSNAKLDLMDQRKLYAMLAAFKTDWAHFKMQHKLVVNDDVLQRMKTMYVEGMSQAQFVSALAEAHDDLKSRHYVLLALKQRGIDSYDEFKVFATTTNHRILKIEMLDETMDVGTLAIDIDEKYHDYHTYALSAGVFVKNSIDDLKYFNNKMLRALGVPSSYLPTGPEDGTSAVSDGRVGSAFIQEFRFSKVVARYQKQIAESFDKEFKLFLKHRGITIDNSLFDLQFTEPQSFSEYRQLELDAAKINMFTALADVRYVSKRYLLRRYLGWTEGEVAENERMWREERRRVGEKAAAQQTSMGGTAGLSDVGITSSGIDNMSPEMDDMDMGDDMGEPGADAGGETPDMNTP